MSSSNGSGTLACPTPVAGGPPSSWADCSVGFDPSKGSGDLLWTQTWYPSGCDGPPPPLKLLGFAQGPTGDIGLGIYCQNIGSLGVAGRFNGGGTMFATRDYGPHSGLGQFFIGPHNELVSQASAFTSSYNSRQLELISGTGATVLAWGEIQFWLPNGYYAASYSETKLDPLGNVFSSVTTDHAASLNGSLSLPAPGTYLIRGGPMGESFSTTPLDSFVPDEQGGVYLYGPLTKNRNFGCGWLRAADENLPPKGYIARLDAGWGCVYSRALPIPVNVLADGSGGAILSLTATTPLDLGCGALPAAPSGSTFITRIDGTGSCVFARALPAQNLTIALDPGGRVVVSGPVGASPVDLGGGPLAPIGVEDFVVAELNRAGNHVWSRRLGGAFVTLSSTSLTVATTGNLHLMTKFSGTVDFGGGPVIAAATDTVIASFSPAGAHRMSRALPIIGETVKGFDGCGGLVVASVDFSFDPGCGKVLPQVPPGWFLPAVVGLARFAP